MDKMTLIDKITLIERVCDGTKNSIIVKLSKNELPENWGGRELRQFCLDYMERHYHPLSMGKKERREYNNDLMVNSLFG